MTHEKMFRNTSKNLNISLAKLTSLSSIVAYTLVIRVFMALSLILLASTASAESDFPSSQKPEYAKCEEVLLSPPMTSLKDLVAQNAGARIRSGFLGDNLEGLRCSDEQLIWYMEHHGMPFDLLEERGRVENSFRGDYDRRLFFCIRPIGIINRLYFGRCGGVAYFVMLGDKILFISASAAK